MALTDLATTRQQSCVRELRSCFQLSSVDFSQIFIKENNCGTVKPKVLNEALSNHHPPKMSKYCLLHCCICYTIIIKGSNEFDKEM